MKVVFIYGPPASGKLTVAKKLSKQLGYSLFHNHLTFDLAEVIYERFTDKFLAYCAKMRIRIFKKAVKEDKSLVFTFCYVADEDDKFVKKVVDVVGLENIYFVKLKCKQNVLLQRVENEDRKQYSKISDIGILDIYLESHIINDSVLYGGSLIVDTARITPAETVQKIIEHYDL